MKQAVKKQSKGNTAKSVFVAVLICILLFGLAGGVLALFLNKRDKVQAAENAGYMEVPAVAFGDGMFVTSEKIAVEDYELYGVFEGAESAYLLTAVVFDEDYEESDKDVVFWQLQLIGRFNWGVDKMSDYVWLSSVPGNDYADDEQPQGVVEGEYAYGMTIVLSCLKPFDVPISVVSFVGLKINEEQEGSFDYFTTVPIVYVKQSK